MSWRSPTNIADLADIVLRRVYGGPFGFSSLAQAVGWSEHVAELCRALGRAWQWGLPMVGVAALAIRLVRPASRARGGARQRSSWCLPSGDRAPSLDEVVRINHELFGRFDLDYAVAALHDDWATAVHRGHASLWRWLTDAALEDGQRRRAAEAHALADRLAPRERCER